ncbi:hypothetical protein L4D00_19915, partial [Photobacterium swingsii]
IKLSKPKYIYYDFKDKLVCSFVFSLVVTWFSLFFMAWPTYWFANEKVIDDFKIIGGDLRNSRGGYSYELLVIKKEDNSRHEISVSEEVYDLYLTECKYLEIFVDSSSWWAGSVLKEDRIIQSINESCSE